MQRIVFTTRSWRTTLTAVAFTAVSVGFLAMIITGGRHCARSATSTTTTISPSTTTTSIAALGSIPVAPAKPVEASTPTTVKSGPSDKTKPASVAPPPKVRVPDGSRPGDRTGNRHASTLIEYFGTHGELLFSSSAAASPGDGNLSFLGIVFSDARIARVRIIAGDVAPGPNDDRKDIVMMDDFFYGEPTPLY